MKSPQCCNIPLTFPAFTCVLGLFLAGCTTNPATGRKQLDWPGQEKEISLGAQAAPQFLNDYGGEIPSKPILNYIRAIGHRLAQVSERPDLPWEFHVIDSQVVNAFALPGGKVFISRGMLEKFDNEAQLAGALSHEVGHVTAKHINDRMARATGFQIAAIGLGVVGQATDEDLLKYLGVGASVGGSIYLLSYSRDQENEADELGLRYMTRLGYNPLAQAQVMQILHDEDAKDWPPEFMSTHPNPKTRLKKINRLIRKHYPNSADRSAYTFNFESFKRNVIEPLKNLPPPQHDRKSNAKKK